MDALYLRLSNRNTGIGQDHGHPQGSNGRPEFRIPYMVPGVVLVLLGLLWYGWSAYARVHWVSVDADAVVFTVGSLIVSQALFAYQKTVRDEPPMCLAEGLACLLLSHISTLMELREDILRNLGVCPGRRPAKFVEAGVEPAIYVLVDWAVLAGELLEHALLCLGFNFRRSSVFVRSCFDHFLEDSTDQTRLGEPTPSEESPDAASPKILRKYIC